ncbi:conserved hypothetical protein [Talaromyces stipitatus ATCC 10500]|uniref:F-box domain-containing protein n=1 Tax=Talaromyces stipitatus (strain ATCC 10500 / CBS 375.48 / QM 6759 / NRRL 1006) TaxID=441959 RepID=B8MMB4_TALSN|nr:uncharacterized protein TSTA_099210 [Talaromyces stipitatus ATCC 10500]EED13668.1 conserved hypothetical protein [Talaromyces stipitatus ATCC 10500]
MSRLINFPSELLILVYSFLDNIDDALHLARTCKFMYNVLDTPGRRLDIFSKIIMAINVDKIIKQNGDHHRYDLRLHATETICTNFRNEHYNTSDLPSISDRPLFPTEFLVPDTNTLYKKLDPDTVWSIISRWHALKLLFSLYFDSTIRPSYLRSVFWQRPDCQHSRWQKAVDYEIPLEPPSGQTCTTLRDMSSTDKAEAYTRFYRAITSHWLHINLTWLAGISKYPDRPSCDSTFSQIDSLWYNDRERATLIQKLEAIEVTDFIWGFLARKIFADPDQIDSWISSPGHLDNETILWDVPLDASSFARLVRIATFYLPPPHIIELLVDMWASPEPGGRLNKRDYIQKLGFFDTKHGVLEQDGEQVIVFSWFSTEIMFMIEWVGVDWTLKDKGISLQLGMMSSVDDPLVYTQWRRYRVSRWIDDFRGKCILFPETEEEIIKRIEQNQPPSIQPW